MLDAAALGGLAIHKAGTALAHNIGHALGSSRRCRTGSP